MEMIIKVDQVLFTGALGNIIEQNRGKVGEDQVMSAMQEVLFFANMIASAPDKVQVIKKLYKIIKELQSNFNPKRKAEISCKKGCAYCCHIEVTLGDLEWGVMQDYIERKQIKYNTKKLEQQLHYDEKELAVSDVSRCVFLGHDNTCNVYEVRPVACSKYFVISDPQLCNAKEHIETKAMVHFDYKTEIIASAILTASTKVGTMAQIILDKKIVDGVEMPLSKKKW